MAEAVANRDAKLFGVAHEPGVISASRLVSIPPPKHANLAPPRDLPAKDARADAGAFA
jgi:hypothetical protein